MAVAYASHECIVISSPFLNDLDRDIIISNTAAADLTHEIEWTLIFYDFYVFLTPCYIKNIIIQIVHSPLFLSFIPSSSFPSPNSL